MKRMLTAVGASFRKVYAALRHFEESLDYLEDYAVERIKVLEQRIRALEDAARR